MLRPPAQPRCSRRSLLKSAAVGVCAIVTGCLDSGERSTGTLEAVWGRRGSLPGKLNKPRAIAIGRDDLLYIVDMTPRISVFTAGGDYLRGWQTPISAQGRPSGLSFDNAGNLLVSDTHYHRVLVYTPQGEMLQDQTIGGRLGTGEGEFQFVTDAAQDSQGNYYVTQYGEFDRIQKFSPDRRFLLSWGEHGHKLGQFLRPQKIVVDISDHVWVSDACNHRVQVFDARGSQAKLVASWGRQGHGPGELNYPYDIVLDEAALAGRSDGRVYLCEFGNHRVQKFTLEGRFIGSFGGSGREPGQLDQPWGCGRDSQGRMFVIDSYNHRVQRFRL